MVYYRLEGPVKVLEKAATKFDYVHEVTEDDDVFYYATDVGLAERDQIRDMGIVTLTINMSMSADFRRLKKLGV